MNKYKTGKGTINFIEHRKESFDDEIKDINRLFKELGLRK
jgi:hypothetical protein